VEQDRNAPLALFIGDVLRLRKPHPCGGYEWNVVRLGADIGLTCTTCGRRVLLPRREVQRRLRSFVSRGPGYDAAMALIAQGGSPDDEGGESPESVVPSDGDRSRTGPADA
jgi:hypothetical protein